METVGDRIRIAREKLGLSQTELARRVGMKQQSIASIENRPIGRPRKSLEIARELKVSLDWLLNAEGEAPLELPDVDASNLDTSKSNSFVTSDTYVNVQELKDKHSIDDSVEGREMGRADIGSWGMPLEFFRTLEVDPQRTILVDILSDAMSPTLDPGDRVLVDLDTRSPNAAGLFALDEGGRKIVVQRLQLVRGSEPPQVKIISDNEKYEPEVIPLSKLKIVGRVCARMRMTKL